MHLWKEDKKFWQGPPPSFGQNPAEQLLFLGKPSLTTSTSFEMASSYARVTSIKFIKQELVSQWVSDKSNQWSDSGPIQMVELRLAVLGLRKHLCILSNFQYVAIIGQTDWEKLEMLQRNTFKIWSLKVFEEKKHFPKIPSIWEWISKIVWKSNWIPSCLTLSRV